MKTTYRWVAVHKRLNSSSSDYLSSSKAIVGRSSSNAGFTLIELLTVTVLVSIIVAIATPSWLSLTNSNRLRIAQDATYEAMRQAQAEARRTKVSRQASFRNWNGTMQWAVHSPSQPPTIADWQSLDSAVQIDTVETTLLRSNGIYRVRFNHKGFVEGQLGRLTVRTTSSGKMRRCVMVSTLLGALRKAANRQTPDSGGRFCY